MIVGVPKEIKTMENRVALTPGAVEALSRRGHTVLVERGAGLGSGMPDEEYEAAGGKLCSAEDAWGADMVVKVKEPLAPEYKFLREDLILFTYLHLAAAEELTRELLAKKTTSIAYETVQLPDGSLPLLSPMSEVAGRLAPQAGAHYLQKTEGGQGVLLGGVPGVAPAQVVILGGGVVGTNAIKIAVGLGARVTVLDVNHSRMSYLDDVFGGLIVTMNSTETNVREMVAQADLLIGAVLITGAKAPKLVTKNMISTMREGSVIVDVAVDQGGCVETIHPTTFAEPTYTVDGVVHYGVANMPGAVPRTSTLALVNQTLPYAVNLAEHGLDALRKNKALLQGLNTYQGQLTFQAVGEAFNLDVTTPDQALA